MPIPGRTLLFALLIPVCLVSACVTGGPLEGMKAGKPSCHIVYDAGSSATRLYVYEKTASGWVKHRGPVSVALSDPVRSMRGSTPADVATVVDELAASLDAIRQPGPPDSEDKPAWQAFDWRVQCNIETVSVLATAGMRIAEQQNPSASENLWKLLNQKLGEEVGMLVISRSITGFEEGLYAWIAQHEVQSDNDFGIVEMGGASFQVSFPCQQCKAARKVIIGGQPVPMYSNSFSGWGQDEVWARLGSPPACELGAGKKDPGWKETDCSVGFASFEQFVEETRENTRLAGITQWYVGGAFQYMNDGDIEQFCREGDNSGYQPESACFRAVYLDHVLDSLGVEMPASKTDADWTLGAVICTATHCLERQ